MFRWHSLIQCFSATYAIVIRNSEYELSPPMLDRIVNQVVSGESSEERGLSSCQRRRSDPQGARK
jgi:hypothetical protein